MEIDTRHGEDEAEQENDKGPTKAHDRASSTATASSASSAEVRKVPETSRVKSRENTSTRNMDRRPSLRLEIPSRVPECSDYGSTLKNSPATSSANKSYRYYGKKLLPRSSSKIKFSSLETPTVELPVPTSTQAQTENKVPQSTSLFWTHVVMPLSAKRTSSMPATPMVLSAKRTSSMPSTPMLDSVSPAGGSLHGVSTDRSSFTRQTVKGGISRSLSVPVPKNNSLRRMGSTVGGIMLVRPATPHPSTEILKDKDITTTIDGEEGEEIPEEEAVCRICFDNLDENGEAIKLECACKGELALAHKDCALKWFGIKGNRTCDVCGHEVQNLPVTLVRLLTQNAIIQVAQPAEMHRVWQDIPVLVMISMLGYFCFLEQLLVGDMGSGALAIALPFACVLGFLASITASTVVKKYIWIYAAFQFGLVIMFSHLFYTVIKVKPPVVAVLLASFSGFGLAMTCNTLFLQYKRYRGRRAAATQTRAAAHPQDEVEILEDQRPEPLSHETTAPQALYDVEAGVSRTNCAPSHPLLRILPAASL